MASSLRMHARLDRPRLDEHPRPLVPPSSAAGQRLAAILRTADVVVNGTRPWDVRVYDERFYDRVLRDGSLGAGEAYMDGWWDAYALDELLTRIHSVDPYRVFGAHAMFWLAVRSYLLNRQTRRKSRSVAQDHYDLGNDLYRAMLDRHMQYSCAYWPGAADLDQAQDNKLDLICRKLYLSPGMEVLELGCGFGGLARFMATRYGCRVVSYNISTEQVRYARDICRGLTVRIEENDYREAAREPGSFDRVVSIGLCEHIGYKNYQNFVALAHAKLKPGGLFLLHSIGSNISVTSTDPWTDRYIFPNGVVPSIAQLARAFEGLWVVEDWHNFGPDYDRTLLAWWERFEAAWPDLRDKYGDRFYRMWKFYLMGSAGAFRARKLQLWQVVLSKGDLASYAPVR